MGRFEGVVVFVPGTAPHEKVRASVTAKKPRFWEAELIEVLDPSNFRRTPPCPVAGRCGGCSWQHVDYAEQLVQKEKILNSSLRVLEKFGAFERLPFLPSSKEFGYRNRIQVHIQNGKAGFFAARSRELVEVSNCMIAEPELNLELGRLDTGFGRRVEIAALANGEVRIMADTRDPEAALFSQVNREQNEVLKARLLSFINWTPEWIMDLYSGSGNLTQPLRRAYPDCSIHAVELSRASVDVGRREDLKVEWHVGDVASVLARLPQLKGSGLMVADPPRPGLDKEAVEAMIQHKPQQIVYVSCNPTTFARDAERLIRLGGYRLERVQGLDMFPQTEHVELIASLCVAT